MRTWASYITLRLWRAHVRRHRCVTVDEKGYPYRRNCWRERPLWALTRRLLPAL